jgi:hypothetical protein
VGWTSIRNWDLSQAPVAHVHDTHKPKDIFQERNIGPPDKNDEADRLDKAIARREAKEREDAAAAAMMPPTAAGPSAAAATLQPTAATPGAALQPAATPPANLAVKPVPIAPLSAGPH